ncbi:hypothetical protein TNCV_3953461 [Trichonephila clavipes]|nr:hypothetical protein TNCV_3953461 [Trichonephila clavipes]
MPKEVEELVFVWASRLSPYPWVRFDYPFPFVIRSKMGELQCLLKQYLKSPHQLEDCSTAFYVSDFYAGG